MTRSRASVILVYRTSISGRHGAHHVAEVKGIPSSFVVDAKGKRGVDGDWFHDSNITELENRIKALVAVK